MRALKQLIGTPMPKNMDEIIRESIKLRDPFQHFATVIIQDRGIIKGISQSKPNNLILDNFGIFLAGHFHAPVQDHIQVNLIPEGGVSDGYFVKRNASGKAEMLNPVDNPTGSSLKLGSGVTAATRTDFDIETDLPTAPESGFFDTGSGSYAVGSISLAGALTAGGAGTINEVGLFGTWQNDLATIDQVMLFHDILVSGESFVLGNTLTAAYTINL